MTWLTPLSGLLLALAIVPPLLVLYMLRLRRKPQAIPSTLLWKRSVEDLRANVPFQRLRASVLLFLQLLAIALLALSVMQPQIEGGRQGGGRTVILVDQSASMATADQPDGATRLDVAKRLAKQRIETIFGGGLLSSSPGEAMVISFAERARVQARFTTSKQQLLAAIDRIEPSHGTSTIGQALELARAYTVNPDPESDRPIAAEARFELFSDGAIPDLADQVIRDASESLLYTPIGEPWPANVSVTSIAVQRQFDRPAFVSVFATLVNSSNADFTVPVQLSVDADARAITQAELPAATIDEATGALRPSRVNAVFPPFELPRGSIIEVVSLLEDALAADDSAQIVVPPPRQLSIALVDSDSWFLESVLSGIRPRTLDALSTDRFVRLSEGGLLDEIDVVVLDDVDYEAAGFERLPDGRYLVFGAPPPVDGLNVYGTGEGMQVIDSDQNHPVLRSVAFDDLYASAHVRMRPEDDVKILAEGLDTPMIVEVLRGPLHVLYVGFEVLESNLVYLKSFPNFIQNAAEHLGNLGESLAGRGYVPGDALTARLPSSASSIRMTAPDGSVEPLDPVDPTRTSWGPARRAGVHVLTWDDPVEGPGATRAFAVNIDGEAESDLRTRPEVRLGQEVVSGEGGGGLRSVPLWPWAVALCLLVLTIEWWMYHRKAMV